MPLLSAPKTTTRIPALTRENWIETALVLLVDEGVEAIQVTQLSKRLGVTRGSFYWHFEDRQELLFALLDEWRARNTGVMIDVLNNAASLEDGVLELFAVWVDHTKFDPSLDQAVRDWGRRSQDVQKAVRKEDDSRVASIAEFFERLHYSTPEAFIRARILYFTQCSYFALKIDEPMTERMGYLKEYFLCFTGKEIETTASAAFKARLMRGKP